MPESPESSPPGSPAPAQPSGAKTSPDALAREVWGTRLGFIFAAVGSAVGLGNMWRFPYVASEGGGAAFVLLYIVLTLVIGIPLMLSEFAVGRGARLSPIGALRKTGGKAWAILGYVFVITGFAILSYYSVIAGWTVRYALEAVFAGFPAAPGEHFNAIATGGPAIAFHLAFMAITVGIVSFGVKAGIERAALFLMPILLLILVGLAVWAATLQGAGEGYAFYLRPSFDALLDPRVLSLAAGQAFFSLSLGMGAMLTFSSYLSRDTDLAQEATVISFTDFGIAFIAGLVVFPVIAALALVDQVGESTVGALFIALPGAFGEMGGAGRFVGSLFFIALAVGALTSAISLLEVVTSSLIDEWKLKRRKAALGAGAFITLAGLAPAVSLDVLSVVDKVAELSLTVGALGMAVCVGWVMKDPVGELVKGATRFFARQASRVVFLVRYVLPPVVFVVVIVTVLDTWEILRATFGG